MDDFWDNLQAKITGMAREAGQNTDERLASEISSITRLTNSEIMVLFPEPSDTETLFELIRLVNENSQRNEKINKLVANSEKFADVMITLVSRLT